MILNHVNRILSKGGSFSQFPSCQHSSTSFSLISHQGVRKELTFVSHRNSTLLWPNRKQFPFLLLAPDGAGKGQWKTCDQYLNRKGSTSSNEKKTLLSVSTATLITFSELLFLLIADSMHSFHGFLAFTFFYLLLLCLSHTTIQAKKHQCQSCVKKQNTLI